MTARKTLAEAHRHMTPEQIAAHALVLASFVEAEARLIDELLKLTAAQGKRIAVAGAYANGLLISARRVQSLLTRRQKAAALALIARLAADGPMRPEGPPLDVVAVAEAAELPPDLFEPKATELEEA